MSLRLNKHTLPVNPSLKIWGISVFILISFQVSAQQTPQQRLTTFFGWLSKPEKLPDENNCFQGEGMEITKIDSKCIQNYLKSIQSTGLFSSIYMKDLENEVAEKKAIVAKGDTAERIDYDRYLLSQDPPTTNQMLYALKNTSSTKIDKSKAKVTINLKKPYIQTLIYNMDWEDNVWKVSKIETIE